LTKLLHKVASYTSADEIFIVKRLSSRKRIVKLLESLQQAVVYVMLLGETSIKDFGLKL